MSRRTRTFLPTTASLLRPTVNHSSVDSLQLKRQKATFYHVRHILELPELEIGPKVRVAPLRKNRTWEQGICTEKLSDRSYVVQTGGTSLRRNRQFLKPAREPSVQANRDANPDNVTHRDPVYQVKPTSSPSKTSSSGDIPEETKASVPGIKTRTRSIRPPVRFKDFDMKC